jgi:hypothetical protein
MIRKTLLLSLLYACITCSALAEPISSALVIEDINFSGTQPLMSKKEVLLSFSVRNPGALLVSPDMITVIIEEGKNWAAGYRKLYKEFLLSPLAAGEKKKFELAYTPNAAKSMTGSVEIKLKATPPTIQVKSFKIVPEKKPDFRIVRLDLEPAKSFYETGETITIRPVWSADEGRISPCNLKFFIDGREAQDISYEVYLPVKENSDTSIDYVFTQPGEHTIKVVINRNDVLSETNSANNEKVLNVTVKSILPDLALAKIELAKMPPIAGVLNKIKYTITNIGLGASTPCLLELLVLEDSKEASRLYKDIPKIASKGTYTNEVNYTFGAAAKRMRIVGILDKDKVVQEANRDNNQTFIRSNIDQPVNPIIAVISEEEQRKYSKAVIEVLEKLKQAEKVKSIDEYMIAYSTECEVTDPTVKSLNFETYKLRISDIFRQYDDIKRTDSITGPIHFAGPDFATLTYAYKIDGIFRELKVMDTISEGVLGLTFRKEQESWKIIKQESVK